MTTFAIIWLACGIFNAVCYVIQWIFEGALIGDGPEDPYYHLTGMLFNTFWSFVFGPIILIMQMVMGAPIIPRRPYKGGK